MIETTFKRIAARGALGFLVIATAGIVAAPAASAGPADDSFECDQRTVCNFTDETDDGANEEATAPASRTVNPDPVILYVT